MILLAVTSENESSHNRKDNRQALVVKQHSFFSAMCSAVTLKFGEQKRYLPLLQQ